MNENVSVPQLKDMQQLRERAKQLGDWFDKVDSAIKRGTMDVLQTDDSRLKFRQLTIGRMEDALDFVIDTATHIKHCEIAIDAEDAVFMGRVLVSSSETIIEMVSVFLKQPAPYG